MKKLKIDLKNFLRKEKFLIDIFLFGSALKGKEKPKDIDVIVLFRDKDYERIEDILYQIKKIGEKLKIKPHLEPIIIDQLHDQKVYPSLLHEGFSLKNMKFLHQKLNFKPFLLITYLLKNKKPSDKVRFSFALYGRKKGEGLLKKLKGEVLGKCSFLMPVDQQSVIESFFKQWDVKYTEQRIFIFG